ncbi:MAG: hypothetical protein J0H39_20260 [Alphaproteobacteria bacterium]|nr:hypothetical protein [Alphaproteobacteria bacterium]
MGRAFDIRLTGLREPFVVHADPQEEDLLDLRLRRLLRTWRKKRYALGMPPLRAELDAGVMTDIGANTMELAAVEGGDFTYTSCGKLLAAAMGVDPVGTRTSAYPSPIAKAFLSLYNLGLKTRVPYGVRYSLPQSTTIDHWHRLIVPIRSEAASGSGYLVCGIPFQRS